MQAKLTKRTIDQARPQEGKAIWMWDIELKGFGLKTSPSGRKTYVLEYRAGSGGRNAPKRRLTIGAHGSPWTPDLAREEAKRLLGVVASGGDPASDKQEARQREAETVAELCDLFIERHAKARQRSWRETERVLRREVLPVIGVKHIEAVARRDIVRLLDPIADRAPVMAKRTHAYVRQFFNWCADRGYISISPCHGLKAVSEPSERDRTLSDAELTEVWRAVETIGGLWAPFVKLLILTAQRRGEVAGMRWVELDLEAKVWRLPGERTKNNRAHDVPLCPLSCQILNQIPKVASPEQGSGASESALVFTTTGRTPVSGLSKLKRTLDREILAARRKGDPTAEPMVPWVFHDLRRTATTGMARLGVEPHVADAVLNHKDGTIRGVAAVYNRHAYLEERREALEAWGKHVAELVKKAHERNTVCVSSE